MFYVLCFSFFDLCLEFTKYGLRFSIGCLGLCVLLLGFKVWGLIFKF